MLSFIYVLNVNSIACQERPWSSPVMTSLLQAAVNSPYSDRLKAVLSLAPHLLDVYFSVALRDVNDCKFCSYTLNAHLTGALHREFCSQDL